VRECCEGDGVGLAHRWAFSRILLLAVDLRSRKNRPRAGLRFGAAKLADFAARQFMTILVLCWESNLCNTLGFYAQRFAAAACGWSAPGRNSRETEILTSG
jgi:hypothetical protein